MSTAIVATAWCPAVEIVDGEPTVCGSTDQRFLKTSREDHGRISLIECATCGHRYVQLTVSLPGVPWRLLAHEWRRLDRLRNLAYRRRRQGPPAREHSGPKPRPDVRIRRVLVELEEPIAPGQTTLDES